MTQQDVSQALATTQDGSFTPRQIEIIRTQIAPEASNDQLAFFLEVCRGTGLNPFMRQIHAVFRNAQENGRWVKRMTIQTGIDGYRLLAARTGQLGGIDDAVFDSEDAEHPQRATVTVYRFVRTYTVHERVAFTATARWSEYVQTTKDGEPTSMWRKMPYLMLAKCAEALALRKAFPAELSGIYTGDEMSQAENDLPTPPTPPRPPARHAPPSIETTSAQETLDGEEEAIYYAPDEPEAEPEHEMTRAEFLTALRDELNLNATQAMNRLKVRSLNGLNLRAALETLRQPLEQRPESEPTYNPKADAKLRQRLNALQIRTLSEVETFIAEAEEQGEGLSLHNACYAYLERQEEAARTSAKTPMATVRTPTRGRGSSALGARPDDGEPTPDSLESLETGARAS